MAQFKEVKIPEEDLIQVKDGHVTYDLARLMKREGREDVTEVSCSGFGKAIVERM